MASVGEAEKETSDRRPGTFRPSFLFTKYFYPALDSFFFSINVAGRSSSMGLELAPSSQIPSEKKKHPTAAPPPLSPVPEPAPLAPAVQRR